MGTRGPARSGLQPGERVATTGFGRRERVLQWARLFLEEVRAEIEQAARSGTDVPPRLRSVHERPGHATPEYRTLAIPIDASVGASPEVLSGTIARFARAKPATCLILVLDAVMNTASGEPQPVLIGEARDRDGCRLFLMQPFHRDGSGAVAWGDPLEGGWREPGAEEMILDAAFELPMPR